MKVESLKEQDLTKMASLMKHSRGRPFVNYPQVSCDEAVNYWLWDTQKKFRGNKFNKIFVVKREDEIAGALFIRYLDWDSRHFGLKMADISFCLSSDFACSSAGNMPAVLLSKALSHSRENDICHLSVKVDPVQMDFVTALQKKGFELVAVQATYSLELDDFKAGKTKEGVCIRPYVKKDRPRMNLLAKEAFSQREYWLDRFHADSRLPAHKADELYVRWFENCVNKTQADKVLVAEIDERPVGFICFKIDKDDSNFFRQTFGSVVLNAVEAEYRRRGIYTAMVEEALKWFKKEKVSVAAITTQLAALPVRRVWQNLGAKLTGNQLVFHGSLIKNSKVKNAGKSKVRIKN